MVESYHSYSKAKAAALRRSYSSNDEILFDEIEESIEEQPEVDSGEGQS